VGKEQEMTREEARSVLKVLASFQGVMEYLEQHSVSVQDACNMAIQALSQEPMREFTEEEAKAYSKALDKMYKPTGFNVFNEPCDDAISRILKRMWNCRGKHTTSIDKVKMEQIIRDELSVTQKSGKCKECKYFEYDSVAKVDGIPLIVAHEICNKWGNGCKTKEDGYCYLFEPQESEE
jgi:hypothetical protein